MSHHFLCELGCEEIPTSAMQSLQRSLQENTATALEKAKLNYKEIKPFVSPRRLAILVSGLDSKQPDQVIERQGPALSAAYGKDGLPTIACLGFIRSCNITLDDLTEKKTAKGSWVCCNIKKQGANTADLLPEIIKKVIYQLPIKKPMRWGINNQSFVRPVHWVVMMLDNKTLNMELFKINSTNKTFAHRILHPQAITLKNAQDYNKDLHAGSVIPCFSERKKTITDQITGLSNNKERVIINQELLNEVTTLVEWPQALIGSFAVKYLQLPKEVLITVMKNHQKCFAVENIATQELQAKFCTVANINPKDSASIIEGNQRVMHARLADAQFFYENDRKQKLEQRIPDLAKVSFQKKLGSMADKTKRIEKICNYLAEKINFEPKHLLRAAQLSKCDLLTDMVGEFPELQGTIGGYYAIADKEHMETAAIIAEQYLPRHAKDNLPQTIAGSCLAIADRIDNLVGMIGIGKAPTGEKDPFALRRQALAIIKIQINQGFHLNLPELVGYVASLYPDTIQNSVLSVMSVVYERLRHHYQQEGVSSSIFNSVAAKNPPDLIVFQQRIQAMQNFITLPEARSLSASCKRVKNILKKIDNINENEVNEKLFAESAEKVLYQEIKKIANKDLSPSEQLIALSALKEPIDSFFSQVMVNCDNEAQKTNRICLLSLLYEKLTNVSDITLIHDQ